MQPGRAAGLDEARQADLIAKLANRPRDGDHIEEGRILGVEIQNAPVRPLERSHPARPHMERNSPQVDDVEQRFLRIANEVVELPLGVLAPDGFRADPIRRESGCVLLEERLPVDAVRKPGHHHRTILEIR